MNIKRLHLAERFAASGVHLGISALIALGAAGLVFLLWYPGAYRLMAGGQSLFFIAVAVDVVIGPLLTFAVFDRSTKSRSHLRRDLVVIATLQILALGYGMHVVYVSRPVALVFEVDRFRLVSASQVRKSELSAASPAYQSLPRFGPLVLSAREARNGEERVAALMLALDGVDIGQRPSFWEPYERALSRINKQAKKVEQLRLRYPMRAKELDQDLKTLQLDPASARYLPVQARTDWVALLDPDGEIVGFAPFDGF